MVKTLDEPTSYSDISREIMRHFIKIYIYLFIFILKFEFFFIVSYVKIADIIKLKLKFLIFSYKSKLKDPKI